LNGSHNYFRDYFMTSTCLAQFVCGSHATASRDPQNTAAKAFKSFRI